MLSVMFPNRPVPGELVTALRKAQDDLLLRRPRTPQYDEARKAVETAEAAIAAHVAKVGVTTVAVPREVEEKGRDAAGQHVMAVMQDRWAKPLDGKTTPASAEPTGEAR